MPHARVNGVSLFYEVSGAGPPVLLVSGLGADHRFWYKQVPVLARRFQTITFDNRGAGGSDTPDEPYTLRMMADDLLGLLDRLELATAHLVGASLGGFIAQEFALAHPRRVAKLVLCCTSFGGPRSEPIPADALRVLLTRTGDAERDLRAFLPMQFATDFMQTHSGELEAYVAWRVAHPQPPHAYQRQLMAGAAHNTEDRLSALRLPVLILHGAQDRVVPVRNGELLAKAILGAQLRIVPEGGHLFLWERADDANREIIEFLEHA